MIGAALCRRLEEQGKHFLQLSRNHSGISTNRVHWNPEKQLIDKERLRQVESLVHLAGEPVGQRWSYNVRNRIRGSRVEGTRLLCETLASNHPPPKTLVSASAIGIYGSSSSLVHNESSPQGKGFLAEVVREWEEASQPLKEAGTRVVHMRIGLVISPHGGALAKMLLPFRLGIGGTIGSGQQVMSWIALEDIVRAILFFLEDEEQEGVYNLVAPNPVTNAEFTAILGWTLKRPTLLPVPELVLRILFGEMATETMLASQEVTPERLQQAGFEFKYPELKHALKACLSDRTIDS